MFIVVEGTDASGKSTLVSEIERQLKSMFPSNNVEFFHKSKPDMMTRRWVLNDYVNSIQDIDWTQRLAVADRWHWGEITYAPLKRPESNSDGYGLLGVAGWRWVELFLASRGVHQFWLYQPLDVIQRRLSSRGDDYVTADELGKILGQYRLAADEVATEFEMLNPSSESLQDIPMLAERIISNSHYAATKAASLKQFPWYIGRHDAQALLVGDRQNIKEAYGQETILPFMPVDGNSGDFLLSSLPGNSWKTMGIINVNDEHVTQVDELWQVLKRPRIIALGTLAEKGLKAHGFKEHQYVVLPHPQYVRRFFNSRKMHYGHEIFKQSLRYDRESQWILR